MINKTPYTLALAKTNREQILQGLRAALEIIERRKPEGDLETLTHSTGVYPEGLQDILSERYYQLLLDILEPGVPFLGPVPSVAQVVQDVLTRNENKALTDEEFYNSLLRQGWTSKEAAANDAEQYRLTHMEI